MKRGLTAAIVAVTVLVLAGLASAGTLANSGSFDRTTTIRSTGASATESGKYYWKGDNVREDRYSVGSQLIQLKVGKTIYLCNPDAKSAMKFVLPDKMQKSVVQALAEGMGRFDPGKKVGTSKVAGFPCDVYVSSKKMGAVMTHSKVYISTDPRLPIPLKVELAIGKATQTVETRNIRLNAKISDSMFALPKGTKVTERKLGAAPAPAMPKGKK